MTTTSILARKRPPDTQQSRDAGGWLALAASPTFASMAWISTNDMQAMICASGTGILPIGGMVWMYLLMSFFHLSPWLKLASALSRQFTRPNPQVQGD
ncbi:hypothetical protein [Aquamicrobium sp. LC103]|uniref:hypothetical protein n=1 Tax=Aquamicrobium sp. LC103 TaxID=1120658 RepID=UPI00063EA423|nr:hypothetical protein [Aquamicrobium sp. LC103]TKT74366.1 hypothetical protein XW59_023255 [Aquamicrobium sp. LC103]